MNSKQIHRWDGRLLILALLIGAGLEAVAIAPLLLSPWGYAGPQSLWGWLGVLLHVPALFVIWMLSMLGDKQDISSVDWGFTDIYFLQTFMLAYVVFVWLRWRKRKGRL
ncbi:MAG TPA: hypothetical protein VK208_15065 [Pyrinomonadaceae bacterium]|nr:hypothetical protein [Pyrinomonadaceae bacterium]